MVIYITSLHGIAFFVLNLVFQPFLIPFRCINLSDLENKVARNKVGGSAFYQQKKKSFMFFFHLFVGRLSLF